MSSSFDFFSEEEKVADKSSPKKMAQSPKKVTPKPPPTPQASVTVNPKPPSAPVVPVDSKRIAEAQAEHSKVQDLLLRSNRILAESTENFSKVMPEAQTRFIEAVRDLHALTEKTAASFEAARASIQQQSEISKDLLVHLSQQSQLVTRLLERLPATPAAAASAGRARAPAPEVAAPKGLDNESKSDKAKRLKKEKEEAAAAAAASASSKKDDDDETDEKKKPAAGEKRKASPEREKKAASSASSSKVKGDHPAEKKQKVAAKKPAAKKKPSSRSDDESSASSASEDEDEHPRTPKKKKGSSKPSSPEPSSKAQEMDD